MRDRSLRFTSREFRVAPGSPLADLAPGATPIPPGEPQMLEFNLPDLSAYSTAREKARILLESAAEVEQALMVQYLYAAYSLRVPESEADSGRAAALEEWRESIIQVAKEEMGHLLTVENLLIAIGFPPNLEREDFPFRNDLYPFPFQLEPLSQLALAKYVMAESPPTPPPGTEETFAEIAHLLGKAMVSVNHVGVLYALTGVVFAPAAGFEEIIAAETDPDRRRFFETVRELAARVVPAGEAAAWHLTEADFAAHLGTQAVAGHWRSQASPDANGPRVLAVTDHRTALVALAAVAVQGEGPGNTAEGESHFVRFLNIFRGSGQLPPFPGPNAGWQATRPVPTNPRLPEDATEIGELIENPLAQAWCRVANGAYLILLGLIDYYLLSPASDRNKYARAAFVQMTQRLGAIREELAALPPPTLGGKQAALTFHLPAAGINLPLPADERRAAMVVHYETVLRDLALLREALQTAGTGDGAITNWQAAYEAERNAL